MQIMNEQNKGKLILHYDIVLACNNRCTYCYCLDELDNKKLINDEVFEDTIEAINALHDQELIIDFLGGEPLIVYEKLFEFIERTMRKGIRFNITSNLNFKPSSKRISKLIEFLNKYKNVNVNSSWHGINNQEYFKANIIQLKNRTVCALLLADDSVDAVKDQIEFLNSYNVPFSVEPIYNADHTSQLTNFDHYAELSDPLFDAVYMDGVLQDHSKREEFLTIAQNYKTICELSSLRISYEGEITTICANPYKLGYVKDGIEIEEIYCNGFHCRCSTSNYKRVLGWPNDS